MNAGSTIRLPFKIDRRSKEPLIAQFARGVMHGIEVGFWKPGDILPTLDEFSAAAGVSMIVVRHAIKKLVADGLVNPRPGIGTVVLDSSLRLWRGNVIVLDFEVRSQYYLSRVGGMLRDQLIRANYLPTMVTIESKSYDMGPLESILRQPASLAVVLGGGHGHVTKAVDRLCAAGVPVIAMTKHELPDAVCRICVTALAAYREFTRHCVSAGIKRVGLASFFPERARELSAGLRRRGIAVENWRPVSFVGRDPIESIQCGAMDYFERRLSSGGVDDLPDLFYFDDDYAAAAAMVSLLGRGIRIPDDVKLVSRVHSGCPPPFPAPIARIESDPFEMGRLLSEMAMSYLSGWKIGKVVEVPMSYHPGATFPAV